MAGEDIKKNKRPFKSAIKAAQWVSARRAGSAVGCKEKALSHGGES